MTEEEKQDAELKIMYRPFEIKEVKEDGWFSGYGATFGNTDLGGDVCDPGCFDQTIADHAKAGTLPSMFYSHDIKEPVGDYLLMEKDKRGLYVEGKHWVGKGIPKAEQSHLMIKGRSAKGLSIGYITRKASRDEKTGIRTLQQVDLLEISPTPFPMNPKAKITAVKSLLLGKTDISIRDAEEILRDVGFSGADAKHFISCLKAGCLRERDALDGLAAAIRSTTDILKG